MRINISILLEFKKFRSWFRGSSEFNIIISENSLTFMCHKGGLTHVTTLPADVDSDMPLPMGFSFFSSLFLGLSSKTKGFDELNIIISQSNIALSLNGRVINVLFTLYNQGSMKMLDTNNNSAIKLNLNEMSWILSASKLYRTENLQLREDLIYMETGDGIYYSKLTEPSKISFSFVPALLNRSKSTTEVYLSSKLEVREDSFRTFSSLYKTSLAAYETVSYARKQRAAIKVDMSLTTQKLDIKNLRAATFSTSFTDKQVIITTKDNEILSLPYDNLETSIATNDFSKYAEMSEILAGITLESYPVHQLIANEKEVTLFIMPYAKILKFNKNNFLLLR